MTKYAIFVMICICACGNIAHSGDLSDEKLVVQAIRLSDEITVDGVLSESIWKNGHGVRKFCQRDPIEGAAPTEKTEVRVAYDENAIYIGARMYDSAPDSIMAQLARRDASVNSDYIAFFIDPYYDRRSGYYFALTAAGTLLDGILMNDDWDDSSWDGVWDGKVNIDQNGWTAEFRIPYSQLRFHNKEKYIWSVNFKRQIERKNESDYLVFTPKDGSGFVSRFVDLVGIEDIEPARQIELLPYFRTKAEFTNPGAGNPFNDGSRYIPATGGDIKIGIGNNLTLDATVNPDFGQVEVDPAVVNLSDIETFYDEKRPFFIEGSSIFNFGRGGANSFYGLNWSGPDFFYTRRIGRAPQGSLPDYDYVNLPEGARILGAAKLSGKVGNNWNIGTLHAVTSREKAEVDFGGQRSFVEVEPLTYYGIFRGQKEFQEGKQGLGFISTLASRKFDDGRLRNELNSQSMSLALDGWTFFDKDRTWVITGWAGMSQVRGNRQRITDLQQSSRHYFQKPGVSHVRVDSSATSMTGFAGRFWINKQKGNHIFNAALGVIDPKFDVNDVGFMWRGDIINTHIINGYKWVKPGKFTRRAELHLAIFGSWDFGWNQIWSGIFHYGQLTFLNYWGVNWFWAYNPESTNNRLTRGGPLTLNPSGWEGDIAIESDNRKKWVFSMDYNRGDYGSGEYRGLGPGVEWKPVSNLSLSISPHYSRDITVAHWIDAFDDPKATSTYGKRYVFAELSQTTFSASIRLNWTFTPKLSLQLYAQPLISSGDYHDFKELARPRSYDFNIFHQNNTSFDGENYVIDPDGSGPASSIEFENPDFNFKSLRGNAVLRWEYMPGSTLYLVWTQSRSDFEQMGDFQFNRSFRRLWTADVDNIFMIKVAYWMPI